MFGNRAVRARAIAIVTDTIFATLAPALRAGASGEGNPTFHASDNGVTPPTTITLGPDGAQWFVNDYTAISRISAAGKVTTFRDPGIGAIYGITTGPDGALWFTDQASPAIGRLTTSGAFTLFHDPSLLAPQGIVAGADGNLWFTDAHSGFIVVGCITPSGNFALLGAEAFGNTKGIAAGADGAIWMTINDDDLIGRITTNVTPVIDKITPAPSPAGAQVTIKGENLASAGAVRFNGVAATIVSAAAKKLVVTVPVGATNGFVTVTTPAGTATSPKAFRVS